MNVRLAAGDLTVILGLRGSGKTNLEAALLSYGAGGGPVRSAVVMDSKHDPQEWTSWGPQHGYLVTADAQEIRRQPRLVYQLDQLALEDRSGKGPGEAWSQALLWAFQRRQTVVVFDEALQTLPSQSPHPMARKIITQGRSLGVSCWVATQAPKWIDTLAVKLADHLFCFRMTDHDYLQDLRNLRSVDCELLAELPDYHFGYHRQGAPGWSVCSPVPLVMRAQKGRIAARHAQVKPEEPANTEEGRDASVARAATG